MIAASLRTLVTHNFGLKAVALLAAFGLWYNIASEPELATIVSVPIDYKNFPKDLVISSEPVDSVSVEARGPANELRAMQQTRIAAVIDFSSVHAPGERTFTLTSAELRPPRGVTLLRAIPEQLRFTFEHPKTSKLRVEVQFSGALPRGLIRTRTMVEPAELAVTGPESRVSAARSVQPDPFDLSRVTAADAPEAAQDLSAFIADPELRFAGAPRVKVKIHVERTR